MVVGSCACHFCFQLTPLASFSERQTGCVSFAASTVASPRAMYKKGTSDVGFAVTKRLTGNTIEPQKTISDRLMKIRICIQIDNHAFATVFGVYAPTLPNSDMAKQRFNEELCRALRDAERRTN